MAKKVQAVAIPAPSSSDEETQDQEASSSSTTDDEHPPQKPQQEKDDDDDSDDETDEDEPEPVVKKPSLQQPHESEKSESDDDDSDDDETRNSPSAFIVKPSVVKPVLKSPDETKPSVSKTTRVKSRAKRPAESLNTDKPVSKVKKIKVSDDGKVEKGKKVMSGDEKKSVTKWTEKDEIVLLSGVIQFKSETGEDANAKMDAFCEFVKGLLSVNFTKSQVFEKIRRLKKKFQTYDEKLKNGEEPVLSRPHEYKLVEVSQKIWGSEGIVGDGNDSKVKSSKKKDKKDGGLVSKSNAGTPLKSGTKKELFVQEEIKDTIMELENEETQDYWLLYPWLCASLESEASRYMTVGNVKEHVKQVISGMGKDKAIELEDGWKDVYLMDAQAYAKRAHIISKQAEAILDFANRR